MANFLDLPREIRNMIYVEALDSSHILYAIKEEIYTSQSEAHTASIATILLQVNKQINAEATPIFFGRNFFKMSFYPPLDKPSVFTSYPQRFRSIVLRLELYVLAVCFPRYGIYGSHSKKKTDIWRYQIRTLAPMVNLQFLQLDINDVTWAISHEYPGFQDETIENFAIKTLKPELFASIPQGVIRKQGSISRGIWVTGSTRDSFHPNKLHEFGEACRELGLNFMFTNDRHEEAISPVPGLTAPHYSPLRENQESQNIDTVEICYYG